MDFSGMAIDLFSLGVLGDAAASLRGPSTNLSKAKYPSASTSTTMIIRSIRRAVCGAIDCSDATSSSRFKP